MSAPLAEKNQVAVCLRNTSVRALHRALLAPTNNPPLASRNSSTERCTQAPCIQPPNLPRQSGIIPKLPKEDFDHIANKDPTSTQQDGPKRFHQHSTRDHTHTHSHRDGVRIKSDQFIERQRVRPNTCKTDTVVNSAVSASSIVEDEGHSAGPHGRLRPRGCGIFLIGGRGSRCGASRPVRSPV